MAVALERGNVECLQNEQAKSVFFGILLVGTNISRLLDDLKEYDYNRHHSNVRNVSGRGLSFPNTMSGAVYSISENAGFLTGRTKRRGDAGTATLGFEGTKSILGL